MKKGRKVEKAVLIGLAAATLAVGGLVHGPAIKDKFSKWFETKKIERIEKAIERPAPKPVAEIKEEPEKKIEKRPAEEVLANALGPRHITAEMLASIDKKDATEEQRDALIEAVNIIIENINYEWDYDEKTRAMRIFSLIVSNDNFYPNEINRELAEDYIEVFNTLMEATENVPLSIHYNRYACISGLSDRAEEGKLTGGVLKAMRTVLENTEGDRYVAVCFLKFLESCSVNYPFDEEFGLKFAGMVNKIIEYCEHDPDIWNVFYRSMYNPEINPYMINENYAKRLFDLTVYVRKNSPKKEREKIMSALTAIVMNSGSEYFNSIDVYNGALFAEALGFEDFEIQLNLAFAVNAIGEEKTRELHEKYGIIYFGRYDKMILEELDNAADPEYKKDKPVMLAVYNKNDWNGAFYRARSEVGKLKEPYKMLLYEVSDEDGFRNALKETYKTHGKIDLLLIGGHGEPDKIALGDYNSDFYQINTSDGEGLKNLRYLFGEDLKIILISCSTGNNVDSIGAMLSKIWGAEVWAPVDPSVIPFFSYDEDGKMEEMEYLWTDIRKFKDGKSIKTKPARVDK